MVEIHDGTVYLSKTFNVVYQWLEKNGETTLKTANETDFTAIADITSKGDHAGDPVIRFFQRGQEFGRSYECCWGKYYNCNRTRIGMYCQSVDSFI